MGRLFAGVGPTGRVEVEPLGDLIGALAQTRWECGLDFELGCRQDGTEAEFGGRAGYAALLSRLGLVTIR